MHAIISKITCSHEFSMAFIAAAAGTLANSSLIKF